MPAPVLISDTEISGLIKNVYASFREKVQNTVTPLLAQLQKAKSGGARNMRWGGNGLYWDVVVGRPSGASFSQSGFFPNDTTATERQANVGVTRAYVTRQIDGLALVGTSSKEAAFETIAAKTMGEIRDASSLLLQQALHNKSDGVVAIVSSASTTSAVVTSPYGVSGAGQGGLLLSVGDSIAIRTSDGGSLRGRVQITAISNSGSNATLVFASTASIAQNDVVVKASVSDDSYNNAMNGLINITNRSSAYGVLHGITAATFPIWDAIRMTAGTDTPDAANPTESDIWDLIQRVSGRSGKDAMLQSGQFLLMTTPGIAKKLMESLVGQRRFDAAQTVNVLKGGYKAVEICGLPCITDYYVPAGTIYLLHIPSLAWVDAKDWSPVEFESTGAWRWMPGRDAFETSYGFYGNLASLARNAHGSIVGYTDTVFYTHVV
jgi:hypothetical protein